MIRDPRALLAKLEALADPARGGTPAECAAAAKKAAALKKRYHLPDAPIRKAPKPRRFTAPETGGVWFDPNTGVPASGVKVHSYRDRRNWRIEVEPEGPRKGFTG